MHIQIHELACTFHRSGYGNRENEGEGMENVCCEPTVVIIEQIMNLALGNSLKYIYHAISRVHPAIGAVRFFFALDATSVNRFKIQLYTEFNFTNTEYLWIKVFSLNEIFPDPLTFFTH